MGLGDTIVVMHGGKVRQVGTPEEIYLHPANTFVANFIGSPPMNLVEDDGRILGFRPESFLPMTTFAATDQILRIELTVQRVEYLGCDRLLYGITGAPLQTTRVIARSEEHTSELQSLMRISYAVFCLKKKNCTHSHII